MAGDIFVLNNRESRLTPETLENLPYTDISDTHEISPDYHGPTEFQVILDLKDQPQLYPHVVPDEEVIRPVRDGVRIQGTNARFYVKYNNADEFNPINTNITGFVNGHPYPHRPAENATETDITAFWSEVQQYQQTVASEIDYHINKLRFMREIGYLPGHLVFPIAFNGGRLVGDQAEKQFIRRENMLTVQAKRVPLANGSMILGAGGIQFPESIKAGSEICLAFIDDCTATWITATLMEELARAAGLVVTSRFFAAVAGTQHPIISRLQGDRIPAVVSVSAVCTRIGPNGYLYAPSGRGSSVLPDEKMMVGDMGEILGLNNPGTLVPQHINWGKDTAAHQRYYA